MNTAVHKIPLVIQAIGYVAFVFSMEQGVRKKPCIIRFYKNCSCTRTYQTTFITAFNKKAGCTGRPRHQQEQEILKYPIGIVSDELEKMGAL